MNRAKFFASVRSRAFGVFGTSLSKAQVEGTEAILDSARRNRMTDPHHVADVLAQVYHETGGHMLGIKETVMPYHKDKNPSDATVIARLDKAYKAGQLPWVRAPYWRDGWFGRGPIMITHQAMYVKVGRRLNVALAANPALAMERNVGADIAVVGMAEGLFTGKKLADFNFERELAQVAETERFGPRRIVNGVDGTDVKVAGYHRAFYAALMQAGFDDVPVPAPKPTKPASPDPVPSAPVPDGQGGGRTLASIIANFFRSLFNRG